MLQGRNINYYQTILPVSFSTAACVFVYVCRPVCIDIFISIPYTGIPALSQLTAFPFKRHIIQVLGTWTRGLAAPGESEQWDMATCQRCFGDGLLEFALFPSQAPHTSAVHQDEPRVSSDPRHLIKDPSPKVTHSFLEPRAVRMSQQASPRHLLLLQFSLGKEHPGI